jgi:hypothetical protein
MGAAVLVFKFASKSLNQGYGALKKRRTLCLEHY